jgi:uncharacterized protein (DUF952 family)
VIVTSSIILHITHRDRWNQAQRDGSYRGDTLETEGFIHCSTPSQVVWVANSFYHGQPSLVLLCIDPEKVQAEIKYEGIDGGEQFPHVYGALNLDAVIHVLAFEPEPDGSFTVPAI